MKQNKDTKDGKREVEDLISFPSIRMTDDGVILREGSNAILNHISVNKVSKIRTRNDGVIFTVKECSNIVIAENGKNKHIKYHWFVSSEKKDISFVCNSMTKISNALMGYYGKQLTFILWNVSNVYEDTEEGKEDEK